MGLTQVRVTVANPGRPGVAVALDLLVDSGAMYSVVPGRILRKLGIRPLTTETFSLANGDSIRRKKGGAVFRYGSRVGVCDVIFGESDDFPLMGVCTLESMGFALDPFKRQLKPMPMLLLSGLPAAAS